MLLLHDAQLQTLPNYQTGAAGEDELELEQEQLLHPALPPAAQLFR